MRRDDAIFNWLQIEIVREARPNDRSARDTVQFFEEMLREDHQVSSISKKLVKGVYHVEYQLEGEHEVKTIQFPQELAEKLLQDIMSEPKYNQSFDG
mgnify:CR=1 FL=1